MSMMSALDLTAIAPRVEPRGSSSQAKNPSRSTQDEAGALSFSGILEEKQEIQKPRTGGTDQGEKSEIAKDAQARPEDASPSGNSAKAIEGGETGKGNLTTVSMTSPASGAETTSQTVQSLAVPMTELMLRIKTGEMAAPAHPETTETPETGMAKDQKSAQPQLSGPTTATLEIKPTAGDGKAVPVILTDQAQAASSELAAAKNPVTSQEAAPKAEPIQIQGQVPGSVQAEKAGQAVMAPAAEGNAAPSTDQAGQKSAEVVVNGQVSQTDVKISEPSPKAETATVETQATGEELESVTAASGSEMGHDASESKADQQSSGPIQAAEHYAAQAASAEHSHAPAKTAEQDVLAAPATASSPSHPLDEGGFKVNTERAATPNQAQDIRQQVVRQLSTSLDGKIGQEKVVLHLNPEKLGQVEIQFVAKGNDLSIVIAAQSGEAEKAIREGIRELADGISDKSTRWQQVDIKVEARGQDADKNDTRNDPRRDQSRRDQNAHDQQDHQHRRPDGRPDWASLRGEG